MQPDGGSAANNAAAAMGAMVVGDFSYAIAALAAPIAGAVPFGKTILTILSKAFLGGKPVGTGSGGPLKRLASMGSSVVETVTQLRETPDVVSTVLRASGDFDDALLGLMGSLDEIRLAAKGLANGRSLVPRFVGRQNLDESQSVIEAAGNYGGGFADMEGY